MNRGLAGATLAGCFMIILSFLANALFWGGLVFLVFWCLTNFGIIGG